MFTELSKSEMNYLLEQEVGLYAADNTWEPGLVLYPHCYRINKVFTLSLVGNGRNLIDLLDNSPLPQIPKGLRVTVIFEMAPAGLPLLKDVKDWAETAFYETLERFEPVPRYSCPFSARVILVYHEAKLRPVSSRLVSNQTLLLRSLNVRIADKIDYELSRNDDLPQTYILFPIDLEKISQLIVRAQSYLLYTQTAGTNGAVSDIAEQFRPGIEQTLAYSVNHLILFLEVGGSVDINEINRLKNSLVGMIGKDVDVSLNVRIKESLIPSVSARIVLAGTPKAVDGELIESDFCQYELLLYQTPEDSKEKKRLIVASYSQGVLTIARYGFETGSNPWNETCRCHSIDYDDALKLFDELRVSKDRPETLLRVLKKRFGAQRPECVDISIVEYFKRLGLKVTTHRYQ